MVDVKIKPLRLCNKGFNNLIVIYHFRNENFKNIVKRIIKLRLNILKLRILKCI
jgi:hypothetical protein